MRWTSISAIFWLFWAMSFFIVLPFRLRRGAGNDAHVAGQAESAPAGFSFARTCLWTTVVAAVLFGLFYLNYVEGWIGPDTFNLVPDRLIYGHQGTV